MDRFLRVWLGVLIAVLLALALTPLLPSPALVIAGSTSLAPLAEAAKAPLAVALGGRIEVDTLGSSEGLSAVRRGAADLALSDLPLKAPGVARVPLGGVAISVIAAVGLPHNLTQSQLQEMLQGHLRNWQELGGPRVPLRLVLRAPGSGVRALLERFAGGPLPQGALVVLASGQVAPTVAHLPGAIGFVEASFAPRSLLVTVDGKAPGDAGYPLRYTAYALYRVGNARAKLAARVLQALAAQRGAPQ
ncbi:MAG: substrate-binding domain-containing protein [Thermaerobacter sp.]|nr:substrate-binding domain-containing protein [Thermaerobacter sp.]